MKATQILKDLKNKVYHPVYFLMGEEPYFIDLVSDYIEDHVLNDAEKEFNLSVLYGKETDAETVITHAKKFPMIASNVSVIILKEAQQMQKIEKLLSYIEAPQKTSILVICYKYKKLDKRTSFSKKIAKNAVLLESKKLYDNQVATWIDQYVKEKQYSISPKANAILIEFLGTEISKIANELNKLMLNLPVNTQITPEEIEKNIGISKDYNVFELQRAFSNNDILRANAIIDYFSNNPKSNPAIMIVSLLFEYFRKILIYHGLKDKSKNSASSAMGISPYFFDDYRRAAGRFTIKKIKQIIHQLRNTDIQLKGIDNNGTTDAELLRMLIYVIMH